MPHEGLPVAEFFAKQVPGARDMAMGNQHFREVNHLESSTLWLFNIAMENCPFTYDFPIKTSIYKGFSMAMLNN